MDFGQKTAFLAHFGPKNKVFFYATPSMHYDARREIMDIKVFELKTLLRFQI